MPRRAAGFATFALLALVACPLGVAASEADVSSDPLPVDAAGGPSTRLTPDEQQAIEALKTLARQHNPDAKAVADLLEGLGGEQAAPASQPSPTPAGSATAGSVRAAPALAAPSREARARVARALLENVVSGEATAYKRADAVIRGRPPSLALVIDFRQGELIASERELDIAIDGAGLLEVVDAASGEALYTRCGRMGLDNDGTLGVRIGDRLHPLASKITIPEGTVEIILSSRGAVLARSGDDAPFKSVGTLELARFEHPETLMPAGPLLYRQSKASGRPLRCPAGEDGFGIVRQRMLEKSRALAPTIERARLLQFLEWSASLDASTAHSQ